MVLPPARVVVYLSAFRLFWFSWGFNVIGGGVFAACTVVLVVPCPTDVSTGTNDYFQDNKLTTAELSVTLTTCLQWVRFMSTLP